MRGKFTMEITLGNDAMRTPMDLAYLVLDVGNTLHDRIDTTNPEETFHRGILDDNGNKVGFWKLEVEE